jgi:hypothetical protein
LPNSHPTELEVLNQILAKLKAEDVELFDKDEVKSLRRIMLTEEQAETLLSIIEFVMGLQTMARVASFARGFFTIVGVCIATWIAARAGLVDWIRSVAK